MSGDYIIPRYLGPSRPAESASLSRSSAIELIAGDLLPRASLVSRLLLRRGDTGLSRTEAQMLSGLQQDGSQRAASYGPANGMSPVGRAQTVAPSPRGAAAQSRCRQVPRVHFCASQRLAGVG